MVRMEGQPVERNTNPGHQNATEKKQPINMHQDIDAPRCSKALDPSTEDLKSSLLHKLSSFSQTLSKTKIPCNEKEMVKLLLCKLQSNQIENEFTLVTPVKDEIVEKY